jgi:hypothetical protein
MAGVTQDRTVLDVSPSGAHPDRPASPPRKLQALNAIHFAATRLRVSPEKLRATSYRSVQRQSRRGVMPSESAIRAAFGSSARARERAGKRDERKR